MMQKTDCEKKVNSDGKNSTNINKTNNRLSPLSPGLEQRLGTDTTMWRDIVLVLYCFPPYSYVYIISK